VSVLIESAGVAIAGLPQCAKVPYQSLMDML
jgi:hypothetical protein